MSRLILNMSRVSVSEGGEYSAPLEGDTPPLWGGDQRGSGSDREGLKKKKKKVDWSPLRGGSGDVDKILYFVTFL